MPSKIVNELDALVPRQHATRADAVRVALETYLYTLACERDADRYAQVPLADTELDFADDPDAWSVTPSW